jgi:aminoglycoside 3-N-acetyltransferase
VSELAANLADLGLIPDDVVTVHSSLRTLPASSNRAKLLLDGIRAAVGVNGTIIVPSLSNESVTASDPVFDVVNTPSNVGGFSEFVRHLPEATRSLHPTHSACVIGQQSSTLIGCHRDDRTPVGPQSPFTRAAAMGGKILMFGCGLRPNTTMHGVEELVEPDYLFGECVDLEVRGTDAESFVGRYRMHNFAGWRQRYDRIQSIMHENELRHLSVAGVPSYLIDAEAMWERSLQTLQADSHAFVERIEE